MPRGALIAERSACTIDSVMSPLASIALSGLNAAQLRLASSAHNVANAQTPGFRRQLVVQQALPQGGVAAGVATAPREGPALADDMVEQMSASLQFKANLKLLQTERQLLGTLLDERA
jgi:flagellar hook protein FlgE